MNVFIVGLGGAAGAMGRYLISLIPVRTEFPILTLITNLVGAAAIGFIVGLSARNRMGQRWLLFWKTGVCGGFTTFSTFSLEALSLFESKKYITCGIYILLSVALCILGAALGQYIAVRAKAAGV